MEIEWTEPAEMDLGDIYSYIARDFPIYAEQFIDQIIETVTLLEDQPDWAAKFQRPKGTT